MRKLDGDQVGPHQHVERFGLSPHQLTAQVKELNSLSGSRCWTMKNRGGSWPLIWSDHLGAEQALSPSAAIGSPGRAKTAHGTWNNAWHRRTPGPSAAACVRRGNMSPFFLPQNVEMASARATGVWPRPGVVGEDLGTQDITAQPTTVGAVKSLAGVRGCRSRACRR